MTRHDVRDHGARGDGGTTETDALQAALDACGDEGGGTVVVPTGEYVTGPLTLRSDVEVRVEAGATLLGLEAIGEYPTVEGRSGGIEREVHASLFTGHDLENVAITGSGTIDGRGEPWWEAHRETQRLFDERGLDREDYYPSPDGAPLDHPRPFLVDLHRCADVLIRDVTLRNSPSWTVHPVYCENVTVEDVTVRNPDSSPNTDGINPDSCRNVRISGCHVDVGDDCVTIKSGYDEDGRRVGRPCENVVVTGCTMHRGHGGVVIGSETAGDVRNVTVANCVFDRTDNGVRIKTERGRGGVVENVRASGLVMRNLSNAAFVVTAFYHDGAADPRPVTEATPTLREIHCSDVTVDGARVAADLRGLPERPVEGVGLSGVRARRVDRGVEATDVDGLTLRDVSVDAGTTPGFDVRDATGVRLVDVTDPDPDPDVPVVRLDGVDGLIRACTAAAGTGTFLERGADDGIRLGENYLDAAGTGVETRGG